MWIVAHVKGIAVPFPLQGLNKRAPVYLVNQLVDIYAFELAVMGVGPEEQQRGEDSDQKRTLVSRVAIDCLISSKSDEGLPGKV